MTLHKTEMEAYIRTDYTCTEIISQTNDVGI